MRRGRRWREGTAVLLPDDDVKARIRTFASGPVGRFLTASMSRALESRPSTVRHRAQRIHAPARRPALRRSARLKGDRAALPRFDREALKVGAVEHVADIKVDEQGTEAAAATGIGLEATSPTLAEQVFDANHPFLFFVRDDKTGAVLFAGRLANPATATAG